jgi:hypothetical protein
MNIKTSKSPFDGWRIATVFLYSSPFLLFVFEFLGAFNPSLLWYLC